MRYLDILPNFVKNFLARRLVSDKEVLPHLPSFVKPGTDIRKFVDFIRWNIAIGRIPR